MDSTTHVAQQLWSITSNVSLLQWLIVAVLWSLSSAAVGYGFLRWTFRRSWQLHCRLKRPVVVLQPLLPSGGVVPGGALDAVLGLLKRNGFLNVQDGVTDYRFFDPVRDHCVVVLGYKPEMVGLQDLLGRLKTKHVPLIVYTYGSNAVSGADRQAFDTYPYTLFANFPLTLLNHIFATVASYPYGR